jgi:hypothetical protein
MSWCAHPASSCATPTTTSWSGWPRWPPRACTTRRSCRSPILGPIDRQASSNGGRSSGTGESAATGAFADNDASLGVTRALGYRPNGETLEVRRSAPARHLRFLMPRGDWERCRRDDIQIEGLDRALGLFVGDQATLEP